MSFLQLPTELKRNIIELVYQQDRNYSSRIGNLNPTIEGRISPATPKGVNQRWGRSSHNLSLVCKELRTLSLPFVLCTLHTSRMDDTVFKYRILPMQASSPITHLAFDNELSCESLTHLFLFICPALPNLRKITNFRQEHVEEMCESAGLAHNFLGQGEEEQERIGGIRDAFDRLASRITHWDVCVNTEDLESILSANPHGIKSLTIKLYPLKSWKGEHQRDAFDILKICTSLLELSIMQIDTPMLELEQEEEDILLFDDETEKHIFPFALSLRYLKIQLNDTANYGGDHPYIFLRHFLNLVHLELETDYRNEEDRKDFSPIHLPHLRHLEVHESTCLSEDDWTTSIHPHLVLPSLTTLTLHGIGENAYFDPSRLFPSNPFLRTFYGSFPTLTDVYLTCPALGVPKCYVDLLAPQTSIRFHCSWLPGMREVDSTDFKVNPRSRVLVEVEEGENGDLIVQEDDVGERNVVKIVNETVYEIAGDLTSWLSSRVEGMKRFGDVEGVKELIRILKPAGEWRKWIQD